jgi:acyl dehydratase
MDQPALSIAAYQALVGQAAWLSPWFLIDQARIDAFAAATDDRQFIHVDPVAAAASPFGGTIAHGYLTLAMLSAISYTVVPTIIGTRATLNYGFDRVRFLSPVQAGKRIRGRIALRAVERKPGQLRSTFVVTVEIEDEAKSALAADWITVALLDD